MHRTTIALLLVTLTACGPAFTALKPAELEERGTRRYAGLDRAKATEACATALETLGYRVTFKKTETGQVKTAPKTIMVSATGNAYYANQNDDSMAWNIHVRDDGQGVVVVASPRGFRNGTELSGNIWMPRILDPKLNDLFKEFEQTAGVTPSLAAAP